MVKFYLKKILMKLNKYILKVNDSSKVKKYLKDIDKIIDNNYIEVIKDENDIALFIKELVLKDIKVYEVKKEALSLEEAFIKIAGGKEID